MKKIAFVISDQHLIPHGGIGSFCKSFCEMQVSLGNEVHIVVDKKPTNSFVNNLFDPFGPIKLKYNSRPISYSDHQQIFMYGESVNYEKIINFQQIMIQLLNDNNYDYIVVNSQEAFAALATIDTKTKVILYTHLYKQIYPDAKIHDVFLPAYHRFYGQFLQMEHMIVGTQSKRNYDSLIEQGCKNVKILPMPMSERELLVESSQEKRGVLFIGRWEEGKNPEAYIRVMKEAKLPCKVMTNSNGQKKFEKAFAEAGITDYEIKAGITGQEKVDFIKSCKVSFNCSLVENYPFAFIECVGHMPVVVLDKQDWSDNFDTRYFSKVKECDAATSIVNAYNLKDRIGALSYVKNLDILAKSAWSKI
jgi:glycosyltransferase involved in cell wall biosynthesis